MSLTATKEVTFACAHMLTGHEGLCANLHGHEYQLQVTAKFTGPFATMETVPYGPSAGMVVDFSDLKKAIQEVVMDRFDHAYAYCICTHVAAEEVPMEIQIGEALRTGGYRVVALSFRPTAELMARHFYECLNDWARVQGMSWCVSEVKLWETATSFATYREEVK